MNFASCIQKRRHATGNSLPAGLAIVASVLLLSLPIPTTAQTGESPEAASIRGCVVTADDAPVVDAVLSVIGTGVRTQADEQGCFELTGLEPGEHLLEIDSARHDRTLERVEATTGESAPLEIVLLREVHAERIVVTASPDARGELDVASPINVLDGLELASKVEATLGESLAQEAGVSSTYFGPGSSRPIIRGLGGDRVKTMENGLDTLDAATSSPDHAVSADPLLAESVEVVRGPATLLYGSNAIGGVVNVLDNRIPDGAPADGFAGTVDLRIGSVSDERAGAVSLDGGNESWAWHLEMLQRETDEYEIPGFAALEEEHDDDGHDDDGHDDDGHDDDGHDDDHEEENPFGILPNSDLETSSAGVGMSRRFGDRGFFGIAVRGYDTQYGIPGVEHGHEEEHGDEGDEGHDGDEDHDGDHDEGEEEEENIRIDMRQQRLDLEGGFNRATGLVESAKFRLGVVDYEHDELEGEGEIGTTFFNDAWEARAEFLQRQRGAHKGSFGVQLRSRDLEAVGEEAFLPPVKAESLGLFTFQEFERGNWSYQFGVRYETQDTTVRAADAPNRDFDALSASIGLVWKPSDTYSLGASLARSSKMPTGEELYSDGAHFATASFEVGDPNLDVEAALGLDLTLRKVEGRVTGAVNLFRNQFSDFIFQAFTGEEEDGLPVLQWSQQDADFWGGEVDLSVLLAQRAHASWDLDLLYDFVRAEFDDGSNLPRIPPQRFGAGLHYRGDRLRGGIEGRWVDSQDRVAVNETATANYTLVNANLGYRFFFDTYFLDVLLRGSNLTDEEARTHTSFVKDRVPLPGRNVGLVLRLGF